MRHYIKETGLLKTGGKDRKCNLLLIRKKKNKTKTQQNNNKQQQQAHTKKKKTLEIVTDFFCLQAMFFYKTSFEK